MDILEAIHSRRSYRGAFRQIPVPREDLVKIMQAGLAAPSGCNKQTTGLIAVDDPKVLADVKAVIDPPVGETAPAAICVLTRRINAYRDKCFAVQDYSAAIENILLAATALGYASCWYEGHITDDDRICDRIAQVLQVPQEYDLVAFLPIGIPESAAKMPRKRPFGERAWFNSFPVKKEIRRSRFRESDYDAMCRFLIEVNRDALHINWNWARWEWMYFHDEMDCSRQEKMALWWDDDRIVGAAVYDMYPGEGTVLWLPEYRELAEEIIACAWENLRDENGLALSANVRDLHAKRVLRQAGFTQELANENLLKLDLNLLPHAEIPAGFSLHEIDPEQDGTEYKWLLWQGFDHGSDRKEFEESGTAKLIARPQFNPHLTIALADAQGKFSAHCGCWYREGTDYAYVEPVCTIPECRGQGLGRAVVVEALQRCRTLGAKYAYVISDMDFYRRLGFADCERFTFWRKNIE